MDAAKIVSRLQELLQRPGDSHKYNFGHVLIIGGSPGMAGAPLLAGLAALRCGAGLVTIASEIADSLQGRVPEIMTRSFTPDDSDATLSQMLNFIEERKVSIVVVGPGLNASSSDFVRRLIPKVQLPVVLDAGGLSAFNGHLDELAECGQANAGLVITPHKGEYAKLTGQPMPEAKDFAQHHHLTLLLKGQPTTVASRDQPTQYENPTGNPGLATAGTGDVLSGVIAGLAGQGLEPYMAACAGAYLHGLAGDLAAAEKTQPALIASDLIDYLPVALKTF